MKKNCLICEQEFETIKGGGSRLYCFECSPSSNKTAGERTTAKRKAVKKQGLKYLGGNVKSVAKIATMF